MTTKTIDQLCARDLGRRVRYTAHNGDIVEGPLGHVRQYGHEVGFAVFSRQSMFKIRVGAFTLSGLSARKEIEFR